MLHRLEKYLEMAVMLIAFYYVKHKSLDLDWEATRKTVGETEKYNWRLNMYIYIYIRISYVDINM